MMHITRTSAPGRKVALSVKEIKHMDREMHVFDARSHPIHKLSPKIHLGDLNEDPAAVLR